VFTTDFLPFTNKSILGLKSGDSKINLLAKNVEKL